MAKGRRKREPTSSVFLRRKAEAIALGRACVNKMMQDYREPTRKGTAKGDSIGLSRRKMEAAKMMVLFPCLSLREIGKFVGVSETQMQVWNSKNQKAFKKAVKKCRNDIGTMIRNAVQRSVEGIKDPKAPPKPYLEVTGIVGADTHPHIVLLYLLPFFADLVIAPTVNLIDEKIVKSKDFRYSGLLTILSEAIYLRRDKNLEKWIKSPIRVADLKETIGRIVTLTMGLVLCPDKSAEILPDGVDRKDFAKGISQLQNFIFEGIDLLAK
ncbi:MAG: hypothetical protein ABSB32_06055 [Thermodesulfobacteriota bacterium]|jgi:hypothetical protein